MAVKDNIYSSHKLIHPKNFNIVKEIKRFYQNPDFEPIPIPKMLFIHPTYSCNHNCEMCAYRANNFTGMKIDKTAEIPIDRFEKLFDEMKEIGINALEITGSGEPCLYSDFDRMLKKLEETQIEVGLVTNGSLFQKKYIDDYDVNWKWIRFSMDSSTMNTHKSVHGISADHFDMICDKIKYISEKMKNRHDFRLGVSFVVQEKNYKEIYDAAVLFKKLGVQNIRYSWMYSDKLDKVLTDEQIEECIDAMRRAEKLQTDKFKVFALKDRILSYGGKNDSFTDCGYQFFTANIGNNGGVYPCCIQIYLPEYSYGNINKQSLKEILTGRNRRNYLQNFDVKKCFPCWMASKNEIVEYMMLENPAHINFP